MANRKISDLTALTAPVTGDLLPIVDISEAAAADKNKKITYGTFLSSVPLGTAAAPSIAFTGDNTGIYSPGADQIAISTNGTEKLIVKSDGKVGILTSAPATALQVNGDIRAVGGVGTGYQLNDANTKISIPAANSIAFSTSGVERVRLDSSGRLLVGTSTSITTVIAAGLQVQGTGASAYASIGRWDNNAANPGLVLNKSRGGSVGTLGIVQVNDSLGELNFTGDDGSAFVSAARIQAQVDGTPGTNDMPGRLVFSTTADGATSPAEALRITRDGVLAYNQPTPLTATGGGLLVVDDLKTGIITYTGTAATLTLPTGTQMEGGFSGIYTNMAFEWSVINTGAGICTIGAGTAHTIVGSATVAIGASARFASRRTAANTFVSYRLS